MQLNIIWPVVFFLILFSFRRIFVMCYVSRKTGFDYEYTQRAGYIEYKRCRILSLVTMPIQPSQIKNTPLHIGRITSKSLLS